MMLLATLWACATDAPAPEPDPAPTAAKTEAPAPAPVGLDEMTPVPKASGPVPLADRPPPEGPTGDALLKHVRGKTFKAGTSSFAFDEEGNVAMSWERMKGDPVRGRTERQGDLLAVVLEPADNTLNRRLVFEGTTNCSLTLVHRTQRGLGESVADVPAPQSDPPCTE
jgi:hypothetical protein